MNKLRMRVDDLSVDSFPTAGAGARKGTVRAQSGCTYDESCLCHTAYYNCGTGPQTIFSCDYTVVDPCELEATADGCVRTATGCPSTAFQVCGTPAITPAC
jgi:hypothetical protein